MAVSDGALIPGERSRLLEAYQRSHNPDLYPAVVLALELLREHSKVRRPGTNLVFPSRRDPTRPIDLRIPWLGAPRPADRIKAACESLGKRWAHGTLACRQLFPT